MLEFLTNYVNVVVAQINAAIDFLTGSQKEIPADSLVGSVALALLTALVAVLGYVGKLAIQGLQSFYEERKKYRSALVRYVYDVDIWKNTFDKNFSHAEMEKWVTRLIQGDDKFKFNFGTSEDKDSKDIMTYIHWLRPREIYTVRLFLAYSELFDSMCDNISGDTFAGLEPSRKLNAYFITQQIGLDTYSYAEHSLKALRASDKPLALVFLQNAGIGLSRLFWVTKRHHLDPPVILNPRQEEEAKDKRYKSEKIKAADRHVPPDWKDKNLDDLRIKSDQALNEILIRRRNGLRHFEFPFFFGLPEK
ncbi:hypothetical protein PMI07_001772 [Rhizobium sp. CF080]|uniref:hypothetical protein n=1 Tax=Rhizobium sp. (strain CF080) TaxID=1144310 RepID=UPI000271CEB9|nr:hypothetical protein [Rhizobium sp. CF080]EUB96170.1 hypothetical protein PMI07_001772 [Rhizobium sp. CF080]